MAGFFAWMEQSWLGHVMRESSLWTYPLVNLAHVFGIAALFGAVLAIDLRLLGCWRRVPLASVAAVATPIAAIGFAVAALTGAGLLATKATEYAGNPLLLVKFPAIALGLVNVAALNRMPAWRQRETRALSSSDERRLAVFAVLSLACWTTAITAGRLIAYW